LLHVHKRRQWCLAWLWYYDGLITKHAHVKAISCRVCRARNVFYQRLRADHLICLRCGSCDALVSVAIAKAHRYDNVFTVTVTRDRALRECRQL
jgi:Fe2+ or Zn2+ uptake regulation protein